MGNMTVVDTERMDPASIFSRLTGQTLEAFAVVCSVGKDESEAVTAFISPKKASTQFLHAIEMELAYSHTLLGFDDASPPFYNAMMPIDLARAAHEIGVDRVLCVVAMGANDTIMGTRDYGGVEVTVLEAASAQLTRFQDLLASMNAIPTAPRCLQ